MERRHIVGYVAALSLLATTGIGVELSRSPFGDQPQTAAVAQAPTGAADADLDAQIQRVESLLARVRSNTTRAATATPVAVRVVQRAPVTQTRSS